ncbi:hypothetical protein H5410_002155 [Solanum commersonii]|uniref:Uncharacterized protein n=1 Tax=Solanum commersonii TaxID=4109 RepID=A0A9J6B133_SOLCO|nr:hypothetical protein H5410_002155 [Solanum commersonii]
MERRNTVVPISRGRAPPMNRVQLERRNIVGGSNSTFRILCSLSIIKSLVIRNLLHQDRDVLVRLHRVVKKKKTYLIANFKNQFPSIQKGFHLNFRYVIAL